VFEIVFRGEDGVRDMHEIWVAPGEYCIVVPSDIALGRIGPGQAEMDIVLQPARRVRRPRRYRKNGVSACDAIGSVVVSDIPVGTEQSKRGGVRLSGPFVTQ